MKKIYYLLILLLVEFSYSQCSFPTGATQNGATQTFCVNNPLQTQNVINVRGNNFILLNVVQGFTYNFSVTDVFPTLNENLAVFDLLNNNIGFSSGANGAAISNWIAPFSGQVKITLSKGSCDFSDPTGRTVTLGLVSVGNSLDNQNAMGTDTWIGHAYNWVSPTLPPGGTSPASPSNTFPFTPENYVGYYNIGTENINEGFGGNSSCLPILSNGVNHTNINSETFAVRYKMRSTRPAGCYIATFRGDDGIRLYIDGQLVFNEWKQQSPTQYFNVFIYLDGDAEMVLDYYENGGQNVVEFSLTNFDTTSNTISLTGSAVLCNNVAPGLIDGSAYLYNGNAVNPTISYQWQVSTDNINFTNIAGATGENYTPPATTVVGIRYFRRTVSATANAASCNSPSNVIAIETTSTTPPTAPVITAATNPNCDRFDANWNPVVGATNYLLYVSTNNTFTAIVPGYNGLSVGNVTSYTITGLSYNVTYFYRLQVITSCTSNVSATASFLFLDSPATPTMTPISCDSFTVNWISTPRANSYEIDVSTVSNFASFVAGYNGLNVGNVTSFTLSGLPVNTPIYFRLRTISTSCGTSANSNVGDNISTWNGTSWSKGTPAFNYYAVIDRDYNMNTLPSFDACGVTVNNPRTLTISTGKNANIQNSVRVNTGGKIIVQNNGSLVQINDAAVNVGNISVIKTTDMRLYDYVYWASPVLNFPLLNVSPNTPASVIFNWNTTVANPNGGQGNWQNVNENMILGKGYAVRGPNGFTNGAPQSFTATFNGVPNNGIISYPIQRGSNIGAGSNGPNGILRTIYDDNWSLVGNPYPSAIDAMTFLTDNAAIDGNIRLWTSNTLPSNAVSDPFYNDFQYNYTPNDYIVYNGTATTSGPNGFAGKIASGQAFMVMMDEAPTPATSAVVFNNAMRNKSYDNSQFYRTATTDKHRIWLDLISNTPNGNVPRAVIGYVEGATNTKDRLYDAITDYKLSQNFYSIIDEDIFCIQGKSLPFTDTDIVPLGFKIAQNGNYTIAIAAVDGVFTDGQVIFLEDKLLNVIHNLSQNPYSFTANSGIHNDRFVLRYTNSTLSNPNFDSNSILIYSSNDQIVINSDLEKLTSIEIYDVLGRVLQSSSNVSENRLEIAFPVINQTLIVKVKLANGETISRKVLH